MAFPVSEPGVTQADAEGTEKNCLFRFAQGLMSASAT